MTSYAPNYTPRVKIRYLAAGIEHSIQIRAARDTAAPGLVPYRDAVSQCFSLAAASLADDFAYLSAEYALTDSDDFFPMPVPSPVVGLQDAAIFTLKQRCTSANWNGRVSGSRASIYLYGILWLDGLGSAADNGRVTEAEFSVVGDIADVLDDWGHAGNGLQAGFHRYANVKLNDHLLKLLRRGTIS